VGDEEEKEAEAALGELDSAQARIVRLQQGAGAAAAAAARGLAAPIARFLPGPDPLSLGAVLTWLVSGESRALRAPSPFSDEGSFVVEDRGLITAQGAGDAFLLGRRFIARLEASGTSW
jgi:putative intracellular protease/amidase